MDSFFVRFKNPLVLVLLLLAQTIGLAVQVRRPVERGAPDSEKVSFARSGVVALVTPVERLVHTSGQIVSSTWGNYLDLRHTRQENLALQHEVDQMRLEQAAIAEDAMQGHRLQTLLAFQQHYISATVAAQVIGTSGTDLSRVLYIDKGAADGLVPDMAVITPDGIVGKVRDVFPGTAPHAAQVLLLNDQTSGAGVILAQTRIRAVIRGTTAGYLQIGNLTPDDRIKPGEPVLTSGGDQIFPRGLPVGTIESIAPDPEHQPYTAIRVKPAANLFRLDEVLIITGTKPSLPDATLKALAKGATTTAEARVAAAKAASDRAAAEQAAKEDAARSAAEVIADRLPSLRDPNQTDAQRAEQARAADDPSGRPKPITSVPQPLPAIHPDHYSPGATPAAASLVPGARQVRPASSTPGKPSARPKPEQPPQP